MTKQEARQRMLRLPKDERWSLNRMRQQGYHYCVRGERGGNPYLEGTDEYVAWIVGYEEAMEDNS